MSDGQILITGAREHNLKNITVAIPRNRLTVITGLSGSGKSSLAFDTLFAEGQRRYVESLSAYVRQFLDQMQKPDVEAITGLSPAIAIEQRTAASNPRSTVATATELHDHLRLLFGTLGIPHCPACRRPVRAQSAEQIVEELLALPAQTKVILLAPLVRGRKGAHVEVFDAIRQQGFVRARVDGTLHELEDCPKLDARKAHTVEAVVDRLVITAGCRARLTDSVELTLRTGGGLLQALLAQAGDWAERFYAERYACPDCNISFQPLTPRCFSFNSPYGACDTCGGLGTRMVFDPELVVPDHSLSLADGAVQAWRRGGRRLLIFYKQQLRAVAKHYGIAEETPFGDLPEDFRQRLLHGSGDEELEFGYWRKGAWHRLQHPFEGVLPNLQRRYEETDSETVRQGLRRYMTRQECPGCHGARLKPEVLACTIAERSIVDVTRLSVRDAEAFCAGLVLTAYEQQVAGAVLREIRRRLRCLMDVGLEYLTLERESGTLSGGETQRIRLASQIGAGLVGVLYVLDEPTIGLHARDGQRLIRMLRELQQAGNTVVVVEHDAAMIREADQILDLGPGAGTHGGELVHAGDLATLLRNPRSLTGRYLCGGLTVADPAPRRPPGPKALTIHGAAANNLKRIDVTIPLGLLVCVTGVSGSGKSSLVDDVLRKALFRHFHGATERPGRHERISGLEHLDKAIVIDQAPIGRTPRSNPATYTGAFGPIRDLFAQTPVSKVRGYGPGRYSFNVKGGRCEVCKGDGLRRLEMHFLPDVYVTCQQCNGLRYNRETLEVKYGGKHIAEVLHLTVEEALAFFRDVPAIARRLQTLADVGLGYLQLGQSATTLSGGEAQRIKLATELSRAATGRTLYLLDEPTTGLHFADVRRLLQVLRALREQGNTIVVVEHNLDVIGSADHLIDLGPEGGDTGGSVVVTGTPEAVAACPASHTGRALRALWGG